MNEKWQQLKDWIWESDNIVFFGGAGVSTESGIPDFRSVDGYIISSISIRPKPLSVTVFMSAILRSFTAFTKTGCCLPLPSPIRLTGPWPGWRRKVS